VQLDKARELLGWTKERLYEEIDRRILLLRRLGEKGISDYDELAKALVRYYVNGDSIG
ncbi:type II secretion system protein VirB, partial [Sulfolobus sp. D5]